MKPKIEEMITKMIYTKCGTPIAINYTRIEHGSRGDYMEFKPDHIIWKNLKKTIKKHYYFTEYRSQDKCNVMVYYQKRRVDYANYKIGMLYISPQDLTTKPDKINLMRFIKNIKIKIKGGDLKK